MSTEETKAEETETLDIDAMSASELYAIGGCPIDIKNSYYDKTPILLPVTVVTKLNDGFEIYTIDNQGNISLPFKFHYAAYESFSTWKKGFLPFVVLRHEKTEAEIAAETATELGKKIDAAS